MGWIDSFHRQCELRQGNVIQVSWIPEKFAKKGKKVRLKDEDGIWEVTAVWARKGSKQVHEDSHHHVSHRKGKQEW